MKLSVPFKFWEAALMCTGDNDARFYLNGVHLNCDLIESTNGHVAYQARFETTTNDFDGKCEVKLDCINGFNSDDYEIVWPDVIIKPISSSPTNAIKNKTIWLSIEIVDTDAIIKYLDSSNEIIHAQTAQIIDARFPDLKTLIPKGEPVNGQFNIGFNPKYLALPEKLLQREGHRWSGSVVMTAHDANQVAKIELIRVGREAKSETLFVMPVRL